ncbi:hypothetical protein [Granulicella aggregans]|nr:hypothetical protein [Granulicella aggregans]
MPPTYFAVLRGPTVRTLSPSTKQYQCAIRSSISIFDNLMPNATYTGSEN